MPKDASAAESPRDRVSAALVGMMLACISTWYVVSKVIVPHVPGRISFADQIFAGTMEAPYQYRVLKHLVARGLGYVLAPVFGHDASLVHLWSYGIVVFATFVAFFALLYAFLRRFFSRPASLLGCALFAAILPLSVTGYVMEGDFITLLGYLVGFHLMFRGRDAWIPLLVLVATFNREQMVYLLVFHGLFAWSQGRLLTRRVLLSLGASAMAWGAAMLALRWIYGFKESQYTWALHIDHNTTAQYVQKFIAPLWIAEVLFLVVLAWMAWRVTNRFYRLALVALVPYTTLYFLNGHLWELAKYLPAFLVLVPVALQAVMGERIPERMLDEAPAEEGADPSPAPTTT